jgi:serine phosphatase RsbU (regulator of sigma subunit)
MKKSVFSILFFVFALPLFSFAQANKKVDSMKALLKTELPDTQRATIYDQLADRLRFIDPEEDKEYAMKGIQLSRKINYQSGLATGYNQYGIAMENAGRFEEAIAYYDSSLTVWKQLNQEQEQAKIYLNEANVYNRLADYPAAADYCIRSLKFQENLKDTFGLAVCKLTLGNIYYNQGNPKDALRYYEEAIKLNHASGNNPGLEASALSNVAAMFEILGKDDSTLYDSALYYFRAGIRLFTKNGLGGNLGSTYDNMATTFLSMGYRDSALYYYRRGLAINTKMNRAEGVVGATLSLGNFYKKENVDSAIIYYNRALLLSKKIGTRDYEMQIVHGLSQCYELKTDFEKAFFYLNRYTELNDSIHGEHQTSEVEQVRKGYEIDKKNKAMLLVATEKKLADEANRKNTILFICGSLLMLIVIVVVFIMYRNKQKHNSELEKKNDEISQQKEEITASITYARRIQQSVMPDERILKKSGSEYFILNKPRDIVSGDFYWLAEKENRLYIALADCTGHGVPGALVSVIGINMLNKIIEQPGTPSPSEILELLHVLVIHALNKDADARDTNDGMDIAILCIDKKAGKAFFAGAGRPIYYSDSTGLHFVKGDRYSVAGEKKDADPPFSEHEIPLTDKITFYLSSDGYVDQFGEGTGKKFLSKRFQDLLAKVVSLPMEEQAKRIEKDFMEWKGKLEQVDDVMVIGVRI